MTNNYSKEHKMKLGQAMQFVGMLLTNVAWGNIKRDIQPLLMGDEPGRIAQEFARFVENGCRLIVGEPKVLRLDSSHNFDPAEFIGQGWTVWRGPKDGNGLEGEEELDVKESNLAEIDFGQVLFETCLREGETSIKGEEKLQRMIAFGNIRLGGKAFLDLWLDWQANKENSVLEWLHRNRQITYLDFFGLVLRSPSGNRYVLYLYRDDDGQLGGRGSTSP